MVQKLCAMLKDLDSRLRNTAPAPAVGCLYKSGGTTQCVETTQAICVNILHGQVVKGCKGSMQSETLRNPELGLDEIIKLVDLVNSDNERLPQPAPLGACTFSTPSGSICTETTQEICTLALGGVFEIGKKCPVPTAATQSHPTV